MAYKFIDRLLRRDHEERTVTVKLPRLQPGGPTEGRYRAVSIWPGEPSCEGARQMSLMRFLCAKAPRLPLPECDQVECNCRYQHYSDRRSGGDRRRTPSGNPLPGIGERRSGSDRRSGGRSS